MQRLVRGLSLYGFLAVISLLFLIRIILMASFPVAGDEAYYFYWGRHFAGGYYDLSPMIGWWEALFSRVSDASFWLRLPNLLTMLAVSFGMYEWVLKVSDGERAKKIAMLFFFSPIPFLAVLISPDVPLLFFSFFTVLLFYQERRVSYFFSGALWGAAFLSKYFALFLLPAMLVWFLIQKRKQWLGLVLFGLGAVPFVFQHLYWNATHCWANFVFNLVTRQQVKDGSVPGILLLFVVYLLILATPVLVRDVLKKDAVELNLGFEKIAEYKKLRQYLLGMWLIPVLIFAVTAFMGKGQGLHWYLSYVPFFFMWVGLALTRDQLESRLREMLVMTGVLALVATVVSLDPRATLGRYFATHYTYDFNAVTMSDEYVQRMLPELEGVDAVFTDGYTQAAVLDHAFRVYSSEHHITLPEVGVWGEGSRFGRVFDWTIDWKKFENKKIALVTRGMVEPKYQRYFLQFKPETHPIGEEELKAIFYVTVGTQFRASLYEEEVVNPAIQNYYPTEKLPFKAGACHR
jgi:hypothetical protein